MGFMVYLSMIMILLRKTKASAELFALFYPYSTMLFIIQKKVVKYFL